MALLAEIFPSVDLVSVGHPIQKRVVAWGPAAEPITLPHSALVISETDLLGRLWAQVRVPVQPPAGEWKFLSSGASGLQQRAFSAVRYGLHRGREQRAVMEFYRQRSAE